MTFFSFPQNIFISFPRDFYFLFPQIICLTRYTGELNQISLAWPGPPWEFVKCGLEIPEHSTALTPRVSIVECGVP